MRKNIYDSEKSCENSRNLISAICKKLETYKARRTELDQMGQEGIFLIISGKAKVVNRLDGFNLMDLTEGEVFCTFEIMDLKSACFFGDIVAEDTTCMLIPRELLY